MFRVSMFPEVVLGVVLLLGGSQMGAVDQGAHIDPNGGRVELLLANEGDKGAMIDPNGGRGVLSLDPNGFALTGPLA
jgi:hypothetical protein